MKIYMLTYYHKHGTDVSLHISEDARLAALAQICRDWWNDAVERSTYQDQQAPLPLVPPEGDLAPVPLYFGAMADDEGYGFDEYDVPIQISLAADEDPTTRGTVRISEHGDCIVAACAETGKDLFGLRIRDDGNWQLTSWGQLMDVQISPTKVEVEP